MAASSSDSTWKVLGRDCAARPREIKPACSSTFECREIAGRLKGKGLASSVTVASLSASRGEDRPAGRIGECRERLAELVGGLELSSAGGRRSDA